MTDHHVSRPFRAEREAYTLDSLLLIRLGHMEGCPEHPFRNTSVIEPHQLHVHLCVSEAKIDDRMSVAYRLAHGL